jgi:hypothetical protein
MPREHIKIGRECLTNKEGKIKKGGKCGVIQGQIYDHEEERQERYLSFEYHS